MKKIGLVFLLAVIAPSLVLAWLAVRSLRDQRFALERQQTLLYQSVADSLAKDVVDRLDRVRREFNGQVESLAGPTTPRDAANAFDPGLREIWPLAEVGFVVSLRKQVLAPSPFAGPAARQFLLDNDRFLCSRETAEVYFNTPKGQISFTKLDAGKETKVPKELPPAKGTATKDETDAKSELAVKTSKSPRTVTPEKESQPEPATSKLTAEETEFQQIVGEANEGSVARFLQNQLRLLFWYRSRRDPQLVFGAQVNLPRLAEQLRPVVQLDPAVGQEVCAVLLDDAGRPVALSRPGFSTDWKRPFVATEIGEALPHWEVGIYLLNPAHLGRSAQTLRLTLGLLVGLLVLAIAMGSWLIVADLRRQMTLARQKTDFVSNVSHELKTPLTSIRMFSEMLADERVPDAGRRRQFLHIITSETARLSRLINNVLDFARMERGDKKYEFRECDLAALVRGTIESYRPHLEANGFDLKTRTPPGPVWLKGDHDALAQILVNLLSNAEKYSGERKEIEVAVEPNIRTVEVKVLDRGLGVPHGCEERIFEQFCRAHDSLASGIQGSGLGLTLARQMARAHGGEVTYQSREGGGSCFVLCLPLAPDFKS